MIESIARTTKNTRKDIVNQLGRHHVEKLYNLADVYHCENPDKVVDEFISAGGIKNGDFDNVSACKYSVPTFWDIGKVYKRLILGVVEDENKNVVDGLFDVYNSWITGAIDNYNSDMYYSSPGYILECYKSGSILE